MPKESNLEFKVGAFVVLALFLLTAAVVRISDLSFFEKGKTIHLVFGFANGLKKAAPVRLAGVGAGLVKDLHVERQPDQSTKVKVDIWVNNGIDIPVDSEITINQLGLLGEKYIEIIPGHASETIAEGSTVTGEDPVPVERITEKISSIVNKFDTTIGEINEGVLTKQNQKSFSEILDGVNAVVTNVRSGKGTVGKFFFHEGIYDNLQELSADLKENPWKLLYRPKQQPKK